MKLKNVFLFMPLIAMFFYGFTPEVSGGYNSCYSYSYGYSSPNYQYSTKPYESTYAYPIAAFVGIPYFVNGSLYTGPSNITQAGTTGTTGPVVGSGSSLGITPPSSSAPVAANLEVISLVREVLSEVKLVKSDVQGVKSQLQQHDQRISSMEKFLAGKPSTNILPTSPEKKALHPGLTAANVSCYACHSRKNLDSKTDFILLNEDGSPTKLSVGDLASMDIQLTPTKDAAAKMPPKGCATCKALDANSRDQIRAYFGLKPLAKKE